VVFNPSPYRHARGKLVHAISRYLVMGAMLLCILPARLCADGIGGDWGGLRQKMQSHGLGLDVAYTGEVERNLNPGLVNGRKESIYHENLDLTATLDSEAAGLWSGGTFFLYGLYNHGGFPSADVIGDLQTASNIEAARNQFIVYQAWYQQQFASGAASWLAGLHNMNSDFYVSDIASLFINSSFGIGPELSRNVPASIFSKAGLGLRLKYAPQDTWFVQAGIYDGDPTTRRLSSSEGYMLIAEAGVRPEWGGAYKLGVWRHSANKAFAGQTFSGDYGLYGIVDQPLLSFAGGAELDGFLQLGWVPKQRNEVHRYVGAGLRVDGMIPLRSDDALGLAVANAYTRTGTEHSIELTWRAPLLRGLVLQPSMQWIMNPGGNAAASTIRVVLLRFKVSL
jgi:porin